jgi:hypothetical protein
MLSIHMILVLNCFHVLYLICMTILSFQPRPTIYNVVKEMTERMGYAVSLR